MVETLATGSALVRSLLAPLEVARVLEDLAPLGRHEIIDGEARAGAEQRLDRAADRAPDRLAAEDPQREGAVRGLVELPLRDREGLERVGHVDVVAPGAI